MATVPSVWPDAAAYDATVRGLIARGAALDDRSIYVLARLAGHANTRTTEVVYRRDLRPRPDRRAEAMDRLFHGAPVPG